MVVLAGTVAKGAARLLELLDRELPGQVEGLYLVGPIAQGDYQEGWSDLDFVAIVVPPIEPDALSRVHAELRADVPELDCDGIYLFPGELSRSPAGVGLAVREGRVQLDSSEERTPVVWQVLCDDGIALRGRAADASWIAADRAATISHSRVNLRSYWRRWFDARRNLASADGQALLADDAVLWGVLGVARVHATNATGRVPSKIAAAAHALEAFSEHFAIVSEALRLRIDPGSTSHYLAPQVRRQKAIEFMDAVIAAGD